MKHLFRVLFCLVLFCGVASHARAEDFHVQVLDPANMCNTSPLPAFCTIVDPTQSFTATFNTLGCSSLPSGDLPTSGPFGCLVVANDSTEAFTNLSMTLTAPLGLTLDCPTDFSQSIFSNSSCSGSGPYSLFFSGPPGLPITNVMVILETGVDPASVTGTAAVNTPEPDSVLLMATGTMMAGLYLSRRQLAAVFGREK